MNKDSFDENPMSIEIFRSEQGQCQLPLNWENERARTFTFFELDWDTILELPHREGDTDPFVNERCMAEALAYCIEYNIEPEMWGLVCS